MKILEDFHFFVTLFFFFLLEVSSTIFSNIYKVGMKVP